MNLMMGIRSMPMFSGLVPGTNREAQETVKYFDKPRPESSASVALQQPKCEQASNIPSPDQYVPVNVADSLQPN
ncbi:MAG: hypothetical protein J0J02_09985 [Thiobacillus sp.]|uniref:hypothetical protein n=1 Tax=Thiobacillus sp. 63-78 TaxID=1895859 RepID=UPI001AD5D225|nr:hypothetical protein [Thiobacillus sp. 63-78]MBN8762311.1 hypothetical protein [Thiobacillus sp.]MBN8774374.1 hypothetical protein [Thiobacillus sp.]